MLNVNYREPADAELFLQIEEHAPHGGAAPSRRKLDLELWGGVECTVNRIGDDYLNQIERSGHASRLTDLDLFAALGIKALRYPVLWELTAPNGPATADWRWADERLNRLRELGIRPIVGLVHHGSGPRHTNLLDPLFPEKLAEYAGAVAERFPWVEAYTPINEILTTARFSAMYGHWYPHARDGQSFCRAVLNQCRATALAMEAVRRVNPRAQLVQTDDLGKTFSTPEVAEQAAFDNERRWIGWDLLTGRLAPGDRMWRYMLQEGITHEELEWFHEHPCPPDVIGVNYYITSERFLDHRLERYPEWTHGGNAFMRYADVETVRVSRDGIAGPSRLLRECWKRYRLPMAVTEAHLGCTRDEQLRWLLEIWRAAKRLRQEGADVRAVTAWSLLGAYDWDSLLTQSRGQYEPGVFDLRGGELRPTALAWLMRELSAGREPDHPALGSPGWWRRPERVLYPAVDIGLPAEPARAPEMRSEKRKQPILITGATGTLGRAFGRICEVRGLPYRLTSRRELDAAVAFSVEDALDEYQPWAVVNTAGYVRVDDAEADSERCYRENVLAPTLLASSCARRGVPLITFSSDLVFDGAKGAPYVESDPTAPLNVYGRTKAEAERQVLALHSEALVVRTSAFFGPWDEYNFVLIALRELAAGRPLVAASDGVVSPTYVPDLVNACLDLLIDGERGLWHLANEGAVSWLDLARRAAEMAGVSAETLAGRATAELGFAAARPLYSVLGSERGMLLPSLESALERFIHHSEFAGAWREQNPGRTDCPSPEETLVAAQ